MPQPRTERRRFKRIDLHMPVVLKGTDAGGREFFERTEIVSVDQRGARVRTRFSLRSGTEVVIQLSTETEGKRLRVVWQGDSGSLHGGLAGLEIADSIDSWSPATLKAQWEAREF